MKNGTLVSAMRDRMKFPIDSKCYPWMQEPSPDTGSARPVRLILDTDMGNDIDDALALAMLHSLQSRGECRLIGVSVCKANPYAAAFVDVINTFYGRGRIPIGVVGDGPTPEDGLFVRQVSTEPAPDDPHRPRFPRTVAAPHAFPPAVPMLRRLLAGSDDRSVTVVMIGFSTNMARLLDSEADEFSDLDGREQFRQKVRQVVMMAGEFTASVFDDAGSKPEFNVVHDVASARRFVDRCPVPILFSGLEVGKAVLFPARAIEQDFAWASHHPVVHAYRLYKPMPYDRPTWDLTAVLQACRPDRGYFGLSEPGTVSVLDGGAVRFRPHPDGPHRFLTLDEVQRARVFEAQVGLVTEPAAHAMQRSSAPPAERSSRRPAQVLRVAVGNASGG